MERLGDEVRHALKGAGVPDTGALTEITRIWPALAGDAIARAAWPQRLARDGTLHVATVSSTWAFELGTLAGEILERLRAALPEGAPSALRFAPGPVPAPPAEPASSRTGTHPPPGPRERRLAQELTASLEDEELRRTVARAAAASLARPRDDRRF